MFRLVVLTVALAVVSGAQAQNASRSRVDPKTSGPAAQTSVQDPNDITVVPRDVQKWIGGAVDGILTGADKAVDPGRGKH